jgi:hypothetical protein
MRADPASARVQEVTAQARCAGYRLTRPQAAPYWWRLLNLSDGAVALSVRTLAEIEHHLELVPPE